MYIAGGNVLETVRLFFEKKGDAKYLAHLDVMRCFTRAIKISKVKAWYTEGFNPHLYLMFVSPLSLGFESEYEAVDVRIEGDFDFDELLEKINSALPKGIRVFKADYAKKSYKEIGYSIWRADIMLSEKSIMDKRSFLEFIDQDVILVNRKNKKGAERKEDIKPLIKRVCVSEVEGVLSIECTLVTNTSIALNPQLLMDNYKKFVNDNSETTIRIRRLKLLDAQGNAFS